MPEGHKIHRQARMLEELFRDRPVAASSPQGRFASQAARINGQVLQEAFAWGKHLFLHFSDLYVHVHLGLYGDWRSSGGPNVRLALSSGSNSAYLSGPNTCELLDETGVRAVIGRLGPDPLRADPQGKERFCRAIKKKAVPIGKLVMDQKVVSGPGNIYRAECLFRVGISPFRKGQNVAVPRLERLWDDLACAMGQGLQSGIIDTLESKYKRAGADEVDTRFAVYHRTGRACPRCGTTVKETLMGGRRLFWCPGCQR